MRQPHSRRSFLGAASGIVLSQTATRADTSVPDTFPTQPPALVREMVTVAHGNVKRVRELLALHPSLAKAAWDWGFGDWEDCLGAASHVGSREVAELLIANGARPTIFSAAMLGQLETVKAFVAAQPGVQRIPGPHSISLLAHARAGGKAAEPVLRYLESLGDAAAPPTIPIGADEMQALTGVYVFGIGPSDRIEISVSQGSLQFTRPGTVGRGLLHLGDMVFHPMGSSAVRIRFTAAEGGTGGMTLTVYDPTLVLTAQRASA
jgi:hypothetical protein